MASEIENEIDAAISAVAKQIVKGSVSPEGLELWTAAARNLAEARARLHSPAQPH